MTTTKKLTLLELKRLVIEQQLLQQEIRLDGDDSQEEETPDPKTKELVKYFDLINDAWSKLAEASEFAENSSEKLGFNHMSQELDDAMQNLATIMRMVYPHIKNWR